MILCDIVVCVGIFRVTLFCVFVSVACGVESSCVSLLCVLWGGYDEQAPSNYRSLLQNIVSFIGLFCKRDLYF